MAHVTSSILYEHFIVQPSWGGSPRSRRFCWWRRYLVALLPRLSAGMGGAVTGALFLVLLGAEFGLMSSASTWVQLCFPATLLVIGHVALTTKRFLVTEPAR